MSGRSENWPTPVRAIVLGAGQTGRRLFPNLPSAPLKKAAPETLEISAEGDRIVPLNASTHEQYLDKTIEKLSQIVSEIQLLRKDVEAIRRLVNEIAEKRTSK